MNYSDVIFKTGCKIGRVHRYICHGIVAITSIVSILSNFNGLFKDDDFHGMKNVGHFVSSSIF